MRDYITRRRFSILDLIIIYLFVQILDAFVKAIF